MVLKIILRTIYNFIKFKLCKNRIDNIFLRSNLNKIFILGNGPSLNEKIINHLSLRNFDEILFVVNDFANSNSFINIKPDFYIFTDPYYCNKDFKLSLKDNTEKNLLFNNIIEKTNWELNIVCPFYSYNYFKKIFHINHNITIVCYNYNLLNFESYNLFSRNLGTPLFQNIMNAAIFIGINLKPKIIELFGVDHSWLRNISVSIDNKLYINNTHFYGNVDSIYYYKSTPDVPYKYHELLSDYSKMFKTYHTLQKYSEFMNVRIINNTEHSFIDAFYKPNL
jgi:hypothetical protein